MKILWNILLGILSAACIAALVLQGFLLPALPPIALLGLRIGGAFFAQWLFYRCFQKNWLKSLPLLLTSMFTVWGYFLYLTSPSWLNATFAGFLSDYASLALSCCGFLFLRWSLPRLLPRIRRGIRNAFKKRKQNKENKKDMPRFR